LLIVCTSCGLSIRQLILKGGAINFIFIPHSAFRLVLYPELVGGLQSFGGKMYTNKSFWAPKAFSVQSGSPSSIFTNELIGEFVFIFFGFKQGTNTLA